MSLLNALQRREPQAQLTLRTRLLSKVVATCERTLRDSSRARDVAEDILMDFLFDEVDRVRHEGAMASYLMRMTVRRCIRIRQRAARQVELEAVPDEAEGSHAQVAADVDRRRALARLERCLGELDADAREALRLRYFHELSYSELGDAIGTSKQYAARRVDKLLGQLRKCLGREDA